MQQLLALVKKQFPDTEVKISNPQNPFPGILPDRFYTIGKWPSNHQSDPFPIIWTKVYLREAAIIFITNTGEIKLDKFYEFNDRQNRIK